MSLKISFLLGVAVVAALIAGGPVSQVSRSLISPGTVSAVGDPVIAAAGDIACSPNNSHFNGGMGDNTANCRQKYTSDLLVGENLAGVLALGDVQYYCGSFEAFMQSYDPSWGRLKSITYPVVGNHEYITAPGSNGVDADCTQANQGAAGYFQYFGARAGTPDRATTVTTSAPGT
jgi:acid phosphatase type 7